MQGAWKPARGKHAVGQEYWIGKICVGSAYYRGSVSRGDPLKYGIEILLPGIKTPEDRYSDIDQSKARLERAVSAWFKFLEVTE